MKDSYYLGTKWKCIRRDLQIVNKAMQQEHGETGPNMRYSQKLEQILKGL